MKKKLILLLTICILIFSLVGCGDNKVNYQESVELTTPTTHESNGYFTVIREWVGKDYNTYQIVYANDTKVKYLIIHNHDYNQGACGITPLYNTDGTLQIYSGE